VILENGRVLVRTEIGDLGVVLTVAAPRIAAQARAGQFVHVRPGTRFDPLLRRPYSFNRIDRQAGEIELIVKPLGEGGEWIASRRPGDDLDLLGPLGSAFVIQRATKNLLLVAGGTGIAGLAHGQHTSVVSCRNRGPLPIPGARRPAAGQAQLVRRRTLSAATRSSSGRRRPEERGRRDIHR